MENLEEKVRWCMDLAKTDESEWHWAKQVISKLVEHLDLTEYMSLLDAIQGKKLDSQCVKYFGPTTYAIQGKKVALRNFLYKTYRYPDAKLKINPNRRCSEIKCINPYHIKKTEEFVTCPKQVGGVEKKRSPNGMINLKSTQKGKENFAWELFHLQNKKMDNITVHCSNGIISTNKMILYLCFPVLSTVNQFVDYEIILPDYSKEQLNSNISNMIGKITGIDTAPSPSWKMDDASRDKFVPVHDQHKGGFMGFVPTQEYSNNKKEQHSRSSSRLSDFSPIKWPSSARKDSNSMPQRSSSLSDSFSDHRPNASLGDCRQEQRPSSSLSDQRSEPRPKSSLSERKSTEGSPRFRYRKTCAACKKTFPGLSSFAFHECVLKGPANKCPVCKKQFDSLKLHTKHLNRVQSCRTGMLGLFPSDIEAGSESKPKTETFIKKCWKCKKIFHSIVSYYQHKCFGEPDVCRACKRQITGSMEKHFDSQRSCLIMLKKMFRKRQKYSSVKSKKVEEKTEDNKTADWMVKEKKLTKAMRVEVIDFIKAPKDVFLEEIRRLEERSKKKKKVKEDNHKISYENEITDNGEVTIKQEPCSSTTFEITNKLGENSMDTEDSLPVICQVRSISTDSRLDVTNQGTEDITDEITEEAVMQDNHEEDTEQGQSSEDFVASRETLHERAEEVIAAGADEEIQSSTEDAEKKVFLTVRKEKDLLANPDSKAPSSVQPNIFCADEQILAAQDDGQSIHSQANRVPANKDFEPFDSTKYGSFDFMRVPISMGVKAFRRYFNHFEITLQEMKLIESNPQQYYHSIRVKVLKEDELKILSGDLKPPGSTRIPTSAQ